MSASWWYKMSLIFVPLLTSKIQHLSMKKSASVGAVGPTPYTKGPERSLVPCELGHRQADSTIGCGTSLSCGPGVPGKH